MKQYELIRTAYRVYGKSIRAIAKEYGHHRNTVRKALAGIEPNYNREKVPESSIMDPVADVIIKWLKQDLLNHTKQRHTAKRIYDRLVNEYSFSGGESTVRRWVRLKKRELGFVKTEAMVPLCPEIGKEAEVDWGMAKATVNGVLISFKFFCMRSRYSGKSFVRAYPLERQEMFFDGHIHAFAYFGGVHPVLVYDNLTTAVKQILKGKSRVQQDRFISFRSHYTYQARFCNPGQGHEKGGVEGIVGYSRRNFMVPIPDVKDFDELNQTLIIRCQQHSQKILPNRPKDKNIQACFEEEISRLLPLPSSPFDSSLPLTVKVSKYQTLQIDRNFYSVPSSYVGSTLKAKLGCWDINIYDGNKKIVTHERVFDRGHWALDPIHYLSLLQKKPGAFNEARPIINWRKRWPNEYELMLKKLREKDSENKGTLEFLSILLLHKDHPSDVVERAVKKATEARAWGFDSVKHLIQFDLEHESKIAPLTGDKIRGVTDIVLPSPNLSNYDQLLKGGS